MFLKKSDIKKNTGDKTTEKAVGLWLLNFFKSPRHRDTKTPRLCVNKSKFKVQSQSSELKVQSSKSYIHDFHHDAFLFSFFYSI